ncbi:translocation/assembly module TamB domain-containing protein [Candidatus Electrothrix sp.]|uniref:translocation/assembly module TamB domain-containing protein n=1 Tax=Candidatus Electrothrix sp. TaxID=2170559 RepID=UPI004057281D
MLRTADKLSGPVFSVQEVEGHLLSRWRLVKVKVHIDKKIDLALDELVFAWSPLALVQKRLVLHQIAVQGLDLRLKGSGKNDKEKDQDGPVTMPTIRLPLAIELEELHLRDGQISFAEKENPLVINEVVLQASTLDTQKQTQTGGAQQGTLVNIQRIKLDLRDYGVDLQGQVTFHDAWPMNLKGNWRVADPGINDLDGTIDAQGDLDELDLLLTLIAPAEVSLEGKLTDILNDLKWQAAAKTGHFYLSDIKVDVPVDGTLRIIEASGTTGSYQGTLAADIHYQGYPPVQAEAKVIAEDYTGLAIEYFSVQHQEAKLTTRGAIQWKGGFSWQAELVGKALDPALVAEKWPGSINGFIESQGQMGPSGTSLEVNITSLDGELVGFPLQGSGGMVLDNQGILFNNMQLQAGSAEAHLDGRIAKDNSLDLKVRAASDDLSHFFPEYAGKIHLQGTATGQQENPGVNLMLEGSGIEVAGYSLSKVRADLAADLVMGDQEPQENQMKIKKMRLQLDQNMSLDVSGQLGWGKEISWQTEVRGEQVNPGLFLPKWSGNIQTTIRSQGKKNSEKLVAQVELDELSGTLRGFPLAGKGQVAVDGKRINIKDLQLQSGSTQIEVAGQADEQQVQVAVQARSDDLSSLFPELQGHFEAAIEARGILMQPVIQLSLTGGDLIFQDYSLQHLQTDVQTKLNLKKGEQAASVDEFRVVVNKQGTVTATGTVGWGDRIAWQIDCRGEQFDPSLFASEWSGDITTEISSLGQKKGDELAVAVDIKRLSGTLRDLPLTGSGTAELRNKALQVDDLHLGLGSGQVWVHGSVDSAQQLDVTFKAESADVADLFPGAQGNFQLQGALHGKAHQPNLNLTMKAGNIQYAEYRLKELNTDIAANLREQGKIAAHLDAAGIQVKEEEISTLALDVQGTTEDHELEIVLNGTPGKAQLTAAGGLQEQVWTGRLTALDFEHRQFGTWAMARPAALHLSGQEARLTDFRLHHKKMNIALNGAWKQEDGWQVKGGVDDFSLKLLQDWQLPVPDLEGIAQLSLTAQGRGAVPEQAKLSFKLPQLSLTTEVFEDDKEEVSTKVWRWTENSIEAQLRDGTARLQARTQFQNDNRENKKDQQDDSTADLDIVVENCTDFSKPEKMPLRGQLDLDLKDLSPLAYLTDEAVQATGTFGGRVLFSGTARKPIVNGTLAQGKGLTKKGEKEGEIFLPVAGIGLKDLQVAFAGDSRSNTIEAECRSGQGRMKLSGIARLDAEQHWLADLVLSGENFQAVDLPEYRAVISPDLRLYYASTDTRLSGTVTLNKAEIAPTGFSGALSSSRDVVIIDDDQPVQGASPMYLDLKLVMGEEVMVNTFGLKGFLEGTLQIKAKPGRPVTALGNLDLRDGTFDFEGNRLELGQSRVFYQGGPIDDPGLDIQASREIDNMELGVRLMGSVNSMEMQLFSDTAMDESEILSYLLTGQDISTSDTQEKGLSPAEAALGKVGGGVLLKTVDPLKNLDMEGLVDLSIGGGEDASDVALVMGKEIYKDLYISYGKDLTGAGGTFKARYDLLYGFSVETATNAKTSGADLIFSWER